MTTLQLGIAFQSNKLPADYAEFGALAENLGFDTISVYADLFFGSPLLPLLIMAQQTTHILLGPACLNPFLLHPVEIAGQIASLDTVSGGRAFLGLARGAWLGDAGVQPKHPLAAVRDTLEVTRRLLAGDRIGYAGPMYTLVPGAGLQFTPIRPRVPVMLGTWGRRGAALAARYADELKIGGSANPDMARLMRVWLDEDLRAEGRRSDEVGLVMGAVTVVDEDGEAARTLARREVAMYLDVVANLDPTIDFSPERLRAIRHWVHNDPSSDLAAIVPDDILDRFAFAGTPEWIVQAVEKLAACGVKRVEFGTPHGLDERHGIDLLGKHVLPALRAT